MGRLVYSAIMSLDGYTADAAGGFDWAAPDDEVHAFVNELERPLGTALYGRRMYETLAVWEHPEAFAGDSAVMNDYARIWQSAQKVVFSRTLDAVASARTRIEREFDPAAIRALKETSSRDIGIGGPTIAAEAIRAGLVDEFQLLVHPVVVGGGLAALPAGVRLDLTLLEHKTFASGVVFLRYASRVA